MVLLVITSYFLLFAAVNLALQFIDTQMDGVHCARPALYQVPQLLLYSFGVLAEILKVGEVERHRMRLVTARLDVKDDWKGIERAYHKHWGIRHQLGGFSGPDSGQIHHFRWLHTRSMDARSELSEMGLAAWRKRAESNVLALNRRLRSGFHSTCCRRSPRGMHCRGRAPGSTFILVQLSSPAAPTAIHYA